MNKPLVGRSIQYRWALDEAGYPIPIDAARRGGRYICPLCRGPMIPRLGDQLQHHYGHESETGCPPDDVTRAAVRRWITIQMRTALMQRKPILLRWKCDKCGAIHSADLLNNVMQLSEGYLWDNTYADVALIEMNARISGVILVQDQDNPTLGALRFFDDQNVFTVLVPATIIPGSTPLADLVNAAQVVAGPCPVLQKSVNLLRDPEAIRQALRDTVSRWPGFAFGAVETVNGMANVVAIGNNLLWLTQERWREIVGGTRHPIASGIQIIVQMWPHQDGGQICLMYITVRDTAAVGVRRYGPDETPSLGMDERFRNRATTALDLARVLVTR